MIEGEMAFTNHCESLRNSRTICNTCSKIKATEENCKLELKILERDTSKLEKVRHHSLEFHMMMQLNS